MKMHQRHSDAVLLAVVRGLGRICLDDFFWTKTRIEPLKIAQTI